jgi:serine/threonine protein kinase
MYGKKKPCVKGGKLLGTGTYGCVFSPSLPCVKTKLRSKGVGKIFSSSSHAAQEEKYFTDKIMRFDVDGRFSNRIMYECNVSKGDINKKDLVSNKSECLMLKDESSSKKGPRMHQLIYEKQGLDLTQTYSYKKNFSIYTDTSLKGFINLADGLVKMEKHSFCHRDIKPENILVTDDQEYIYIDFGISQDYNLVYNDDETFTFSSNYIYFPIEFRLFMTLIDLSKDRKFEGEGTKEYYSDWKRYIGHKFEEYGIYEHFKYYNATFLQVYKNPDEIIKKQIDQTIDRFMKYVQSEKLTPQSLDRNSYFRKYVNKIDVYSLGISLLASFCQSKHVCRHYKSLDEKLINLIRKAINLNMYERSTPLQFSNDLKDLYKHYKRLLNNLKINENNISIVSTPSSKNKETDSTIKFKPVDLPFCMKHYILKTLQQVARDHKLKISGNKEEVCKRVMPFINK